MISVDIIEASGKAYQKVWYERAYLWKLAMVPILIKLVCEVTVLSLGLQTEFLKQGLVMIPAYMAEGWMLSHFVRLIFLGNRWPFKPTGDFDADMKKLQVRARGILGGMVIYTLIKMVMIGFVAFSYGLMDGLEGGAKSDEPGGALFLLSLVLFAGFVWLFRCVWLYVPVALNYPIRLYMKRLEGLGTSLWLIGVWLICFLPVFFVFGLLVSMIFTGAGDGSSAGMQFIFSVTRVMIDTLLSLVTTAGICYALAEMLGASETKRGSGR
jgi:hypothetical protein